MTMGPEPMMRIVWMSVRLGIGAKSFARARGRGAAAGSRANVSRGERMSTLRRIAVAVVGFLLMASVGRAAEVKRDIDWGKFLSRHDLVWVRLPEKWGEGAFAENGQMGSMV